MAIAGPTTHAETQWPNVLIKINMLVIKKVAYMIFVAIVAL